MNYLRYFEPFAIPFDVGIVVLFSVVFFLFIKWIVRLSPYNKKRFLKGFLPHNLFLSLKEIIQEALLHFKIFRTSPLLGYMHMSLAFGWFLLIIIGNIETKFYNGIHLELPHYPIFFKYFLYHENLEFDGTGYEGYPLEGFFDFIMDFVLVFILSGVFLAYYKRFNSNRFGMKKTTKLRIGDKFAMASLWAIFPLRLFSEGFNYAVYGSSPYAFLTGNIGKLFALIFPETALPYISEICWWLYSFSLGIFFIALPFSRYMHIITEPFLIFIRNAGVKPDKDPNEGYSQAQLHACSRCGICIDACQLASVGIDNIQGTYFVRDIRLKKYNPEVINNCLMCGRCNDVCPVGVDITGLRTNIRARNNNKNFSNLEYIPLQETETADVMFFAGCMSHLTPAIKKSMVKIMESSGINYTFLDKNGGICCGRPQMLAGQTETARELIKRNRQAILDSGAKTFVTSCPICYKVFKEEYGLDGVEVLHHTQYILRLINSGALKVNRLEETVVYHDPCDLSHNSGIVKEPRELISLITELKNPKYRKREAMCCGGSLGNKELASEKRSEIAEKALQRFNPENNKLITACPLCKRTFGEFRNCNVVDIAQLVVEAL